MINESTASRTTEVRRIAEKATRTGETGCNIRDSFPKTNANLARPGFGATSPPQGVRSMPPGPDFRGADRERCVSYFTLLWWSKNTLSAMAGRRKRPVRCSRKLRWSFSAVATSREGHRSPRSGRAGQHPRWDRGLPGIPASRRLSALDTLLDAAMIFSGEQNSYFDCY